MFGLTETFGSSCILNPNRGDCRIGLKSGVQGHLSKSGCLRPRFASQSIQMVSEVSGLGCWMVLGCGLQAKCAADSLVVMAGVGALIQEGA